jgi:hypothetical protein
MQKRLLRCMIAETTGVETGSHDREWAGTFAAGAGRGAMGTILACAAAVRLRTAREKPLLDPGLCISELGLRARHFRLDPANDGH